MTLSGGEGDDRLILAAHGARPSRSCCGPGRRPLVAGPRDRPGDGCAAHLAGITPSDRLAAVPRGRADRAGAGSVTLSAARPVRSQRAREVARGTFTAGPGPLRVTLEAARRPGAAGCAARRTSRCS